MRGEFIEVWSETWMEIWRTLSSHEAAPNDMFCELYDELVSALKVKPSVEQIAEITNDRERSEETFANTKSEDISSEWALIGFLESAHGVLYDLGGDSLANLHFILLEHFIEKFNLRYDLRRPCTLCPTLSGVFSSLIRNIRVVTSQDAHLDNLMKDFENSVRSLRNDCSDSHIKTCIQKQVNLLEAMGRRCPGVTQKTLGKICDQVGTWPHSSIKDALKNLYGFANDYPGIRHSGTPENAIRAIEMRDMVAMSILLAGFIPYLTDQLDADIVYRGK